MRVDGVSSLPTSCFLTWRTRALNRMRRRRAWSSSCTRGSSTSMGGWNTWVVCATPTQFSARFPPLPSTSFSAGAEMVLRSSHPSGSPRTTTTSPPYPAASRYRHGRSAITPSGIGRTRCTAQLGSRNRSPTSPGGKPYAMPS